MGRSVAAKGGNKKKWLKKRQRQRSDGNGQREGGERGVGQHVWPPIPNPEFNKQSPEKTKRARERRAPQRTWNRKGQTTEKKGRGSRLFWR